ncbi:Protein CBR-LIN-33 [Caenorhabditis briggsae]|uniref:Protein CBR-LIN-33 n=3 Tax=Caenorhabditis briggsae TaxID=6238 RepID=A0AAE9D4L3_CAEBR|nr:Protein CBR-LIN-33 [Caenorhabditis briggsae]ULT94522.1 hypothetical protein L3Y34_003773 [Caenorhabditis briggsae]UMM27773.1 hypothetical protein L5515_010921 [Caenorhabditis briggsae]CAP29129.1 Protein CBR-LIN-33 [Caenorhabditis briggsae]
MSSRGYYRAQEEIVQAKILHRDPGIIEENYASKPPSRRSSSHTNPDSLVNQKHAQPLPSPLHSPVRSVTGSSKHESPKMAPASERQHSRQSSASSEEDLGTRSVAVSVLKDSGTKVEIMLKAHGLKKKKSLFNSLVTVFKKPSQPSRLLANGKFTEFTLTEHSLRFLLEVKTDKKKKKGNGNRLDTFLCEVKRFPSDVNPDSAEFEVLEPASGEAFILLTLIKVGNLSTNWKEFLDSNGTIDVSTI